MIYRTASDWLAALKAVSRECFFEWAREADALNRLPERSIECLRELVWWDWHERLSRRRKETSALTLGSCARLLG